MCPESVPASRSGLQPPSIEDVRGARQRIAGLATRTPLIRLPFENGPEIWLKLENLQPIGSFKLRGAGNAIALRPAAELAGGVCTASAGNMAQGVAWCARERGIPCRVIVPDRAPAAKIDAIRRLGAEVVQVPFAQWWEVIETHDTGGIGGAFIHPVEDPAVMAGNGTIALELLEDLPDVDAVVVPYGGGGLSCGIAAALSALRPGCAVYAAEVETAAPLRAALDAGGPHAIDHRRSWVDGIGGGGLLPRMWPLARALLTDAVVASLSQVADGVRILATRAHVVAEGAGGAALAAALSGRVPGSRIVCVISGGNIDPAVLARILLGEVPA
jgi:threonine dehydratase